MKTVLITGSTSGLGLGVAIEFAKAGYNIVFNGLEKEGPEIAADVAQKYNVGTMYSAANMTKPEEITEMVNAGIAKFGGIDVLINNAGIQFVAPIDEFPEQKWNDIIAINMSSAFHTSKAVWPGMKAKKSGRIINISSVHGLVASEFKSAYVSAKHGVVGLTKVLGLEGAPLGITVNAICPGYVKTPLVEKQIKDQAKAHNIPESDVINKVLLVKQSIKDFVSIEAIGALALFLASENAAMITGTAIPMDGGWSAQ